MEKIELRIPPVLVTVTFAGLMWLVSLSFPGIAVPMTLKVTMFFVLLCMGVVFSVAGVVAFMKAKTSVNPIKPDGSSSLVTTGVYRVSRNPMYVGFLFMLLALGVLLSNLYSIALSAGYVLYMNRFQIQREEAALESSFGEIFRQYRQDVRRWL